ncbi:MAG: methylated-DNA--[protein]-cysteine S-methyltransferase [Planctomycetes bacterium]|nr:methylated-DNA--[protein]-cysteine S-methyltransferase [Planctomycetota bacterium]
MDAYRGAILQTPIAPLLLLATPRGLARVVFLGPGRSRLPAAFDGISVVEDPRALQGATAAIRAYACERRPLPRLALDLGGASAFDRLVWRALLRIPFGKVAGYGEVARAIGRPGAARAVGGAVGRNPLPIVVPCHRVVRSDGSLGGFSAGLAIKRRLLANEGLVPEFPLELANLRP